MTARLNAIVCTSALSLRRLKRSAKIPPANVPDSAPIMILINFFLFWHIGPINTLIANVSPPNVRGVAISLQILTIHLLGDAFSPALIGAASDTLQARGVEAGEALRSVLLFLLPVPVFLAALCSEIAGLWAPADMRRVVGDPAAHGNAELVVAAGH